MSIGLLDKIGFRRAIQSEAIYSWADKLFIEEIGGFGIKAHAFVDQVVLGPFV
jgi:hypothetical protein